MDFFQYCTNEDGTFNIREMNTMILSNNLPNHNPESYPHILENYRHNTVDNLVNESSARNEEHTSI